MLRREGNSAAMRNEQSLRTPGSFALHFVIFLGFTAAAVGGVRVQNGLEVRDLTELETIRSTQKCTKEERLEHVVCVYENLLLYNGTIYFVSEDASLDTKPVHVALRLDEGLGSPTTVKPIKIAPGRLPFSWTSARKFEIRDAILNYIPGWPSVLNMMGEYMPSLHSVLCQHLGRCKFEDRKHTIVVSLNPDVPDTVDWNAAVLDAFHCLSARPPLWMHHKDLEGAVLIVRRAVMGYGSTCRVDHLHCTGNPEMPGFGRGPALPSVMQSWVERMQHCVGLDPEESVDVTNPKFVLLDRDYQSGRHILNVGDVLRELQTSVGARHHLFPTNFEIAKLEGMPLRPQAAIFHDATVLVLVHGAGLANAVFLRKDAVIIHLLHQPWYYNLHLYAEAMVAAYGFRNWSLVEETNKDPARLSVMTERVTISQYYHTMTSEQRMALLEKKQCPPQEVVPRAWCALEWVHRGTNVQLDEKLVVGAVERGLAMLRSRLGVAQLPFEALAEQGAASRAEVTDRKEPNRAAGLAVQAVRHRPDDKNMHDLLEQQAVAQEARQAGAKGAMAAVTAQAAAQRNSVAIEKAQLQAKKQREAAVAAAAEEAARQAVAAAVQQQQQQAAAQAAAQAAEQQQQQQAAAEATQQQQQAAAAAAQQQQQPVTVGAAEQQAQQQAAETQQQQLLAQQQQQAEAAAQAQAQQQLITQQQVEAAAQAQQQQQAVAAVQQQQEQPSAEQQAEAAAQAQQAQAQQLLAQQQAEAAVQAQQQQQAAVAIQQQQEQPSAEQQAEAAAQAQQAQAQLVLAQQQAEAEAQAQAQQLLAQQQAEAAAQAQQAQAQQLLVQQQAEAAAQAQQLQAQRRA